ncbi:hypothetical protein STEG23_010640 [Scotinomys teguina]
MTTVVAAAAADGSEGPNIDKTKASKHMQTFTKRGRTVYKKPLIHVQRSPEDCEGQNSKVETVKAPFSSSLDGKIVLHQHCAPPYLAYSQLVSCGAFCFMCCTGKPTKVLVAVKNVVPATAVSNNDGQFNQHQGEDAVEQTRLSSQAFLHLGRYQIVTHSESPVNPENPSQAWRYALIYGEKHASNSQTGFYGAEVSLVITPNQGNFSLQQMKTTIEKHN